MFVSTQEKEGCQQNSIPPPTEIVGIVSNCISIAVTTTHEL